MAYLPRDHVIGTRSVAADSQPADDVPFSGVERKPAAENYEAADGFSYHRVTIGAETGWGTGGDLGIWRRSADQPIEALSGLRRIINIGRGEGVIRAAERVRG